MILKYTYILAGFLVLSNSTLFSQTLTFQLASRVYYFDQNGLSGETPVQILEPNNCNNFVWGMKNLVRHGDIFYHTYQARVNGADNDIYLRTSTDGITWSSRIQVSDDSLDSNQRMAIPVIYGDPQQPDICIVWEDLRNSNSAQLRAATSNDGGNTFSPSVQITDHDDAVRFNHSIAVDANGILYLTWTRGTDTGAYFTTWFSKSTDGGASWTPRFEVYTGRIFSYPPEIVARSNGELLLTIHDNQNNGSDLIVFTSTDGGNTWSTAASAAIYNNSTLANLFYYTIVKDPNDVVHFVHQYTFSNANINYKYAQSTDWGNSWTPFVQISDTAYSQLQPVFSQTNSPSLAIADNGHIYSAWADQRLDVNNSNYEMFLTRSLDNGATWSDDLQINERPELETQFYVSLGVKSGAVIDTVVMVWLEASDTTTTAINYQPILSQNFVLKQNYPNPFNPSTTIEFGLPAAAVVSLEIFDLLGQPVVGAYRDTPLRSGVHEWEWNGTDAAGNPAPSGIYFYRLKIDNRSTATRKMILLN